ncbi:MAG: sulfur carrier protein ThiS [Gammaproteobacteria bacterium]|nr:sulfur carrier protein ThiS [Gammaproteobacteria bacterium]
MISVCLNNKTILVKKESSLLSILQEHIHLQSCYAVTLNQHFVPAAKHGTTQLKQNDVIEIVTPMQGG